MKRPIIFTLTLAIILSLAGHMRAAATCEKDLNNHYEQCYIKTMTHMDFIAPAGANNLICRVYKQHDRCIAYYAGGKLIAEFGHEFISSEGVCSLCGYQTACGVCYDVGTVGTPVD